jgi:hypothetical protein
MVTLFCAEPDLYIHLSSEFIWHFDGGRRLTMTALCYRSMWYNLTLVLSYWNTISICIYTSHVVCTSAGINDIRITIVCIRFNLVLYAVTGAYLYISLLSSGGCFGAWIDHLDSFKNPNPWHSKVGFLKVVCYKHCIVHTDACDVGAGSYCEGDYFYCNWSVDLPAVQDSHINFKELAAVVLAAQRWGPLWANKHVVVLSDNSTTVACINRGSSRSVLLMKYLRHIFWLSAVFNFRLKVVHVRGEDNVLVTTLSR